MIFRPRALPALIFRHRTVLALITGALAFSSGSSFAVDILRSSPGAAVHDSSSTSQSSAASVSQTSTSATAAAAEQAQTAVLAARAQSSLMRATAALHAKQQSELSAQQAAAIASTPSVPSGGLVVHGLVPGTVGIDPADPTTVAIPIPVITNAQGLASITLPAPAATGSASDITLPGSVKGNTQITVSGTGVVGTITTGETITTLTGGASTTVTPGSTISLTNGGTITFANGSAGIPTSFNTYSFPGVSSTAPSVPGSWTGVGGLSQATYGGSGQTTVTIDQNAQQALLTWQSFNIGKNTLLDFDQSAGGTNVGQWVAINKVAANVAPSDILGAIQAPARSTSSIKTAFFSAGRRRSTLARWLPRACRSMTTSSAAACSIIPTTSFSLRRSIRWPAATVPRLPSSLPRHLQRAPSSRQTPPEMRPPRPPVASTEMWSCRPALS